MKKLILSLLSFAATILTVVAQTDVYNNGQLYLTNTSDTVFITGSLTNNTTATLTNAGGNIYVLKDINNSEATMVAGAGKLWFTGNSAQTVTGSEPFRTNTWIVDNTAGVLLQNRMGIGNGAGGTLNFVNGIVTSGNQLQDVFFYPNSTYTGYADDKHIIGYCSKSGSTNFTFPIGNGSLKADLDIFNLASATDFQCKYFGLGYGVYTPQSPLVSVFQKEYWTLDRTAGTSPAQITLKWNDARKPLNHTLPADLRVGHFTGGIWINEGGTGSGNTVTGTVSSVAVNSFSPFTFASVGVALPLKISDYSVTVGANCSVNIYWKAEDETALRRYVLQKSSDGQSWEDLAPVYSNNQLNALTEHRYVDNKTSNGSWLYRIKVENIGGDYFYTKAKVVTLTCGNGGIKAFPTLVSTNVYLSIPPGTVLKSILVNNNDGRLIKKINNPGTGAIVINLSGYPAGEYTIVACLPGGNSYFKIVKGN